MAPWCFTTDLFLDCEGITPTFKDISNAKLLDDLKQLIPSPWDLVKAHPELHNKGKKDVVLPPLLAKILMDANLEDPYIVLQACCKTILDFDKAAPEMVEVELRRTMIISLLWCPSPSFG